MRDLAKALHDTEATDGGRLLVRALLALGALGEHPKLRAVVLDLRGRAAREALGLSLSDVELLVDRLEVVRYVDGVLLVLTTLGRAVVALDEHQHETELGVLSSAPRTMARLAVVRGEEVEQS